jgi:hypothetical protein
MKGSRTLGIFRLFALLAIFPTYNFAQDSSTTSNRQVVTRTMPVYPQLARSMNMTGVVRG